MGKKKKSKKRGSREHGRGKKAGRGAGLRGGRGQAGAMKHKRTGTLKQDPKYWGDYGFSRPQKVQEHVETLNVRDVDETVPELLEEDVASQEGDLVKVDLGELGIDKLLGAGQVHHSLEITVEDASDSAVRKVEEAGGTVVLTGDEDEADEADETPDDDAE